MGSSTCELLCVAVAAGRVLQVKYGQVLDKEKRRKKATQGKGMLNWMRKKERCLMADWTRECTRNQGNKKGGGAPKEQEV
eukprot:87411-Pelagomonas_calceolata.AAC.3